MYEFIQTETGWIVYWGTPVSNENPRPNDDMLTYSEAPEDYKQGNDEVAPVMTV